MDIVFLSHTAQTGAFRVGSHHLAREMSRLGHRVVHLTTPLTAAHVLRVGDSDVRHRAVLAFRPAVDEDGVCHIVALAASPIGRWGPRYRGALGRLSGRWLARMVAGAGMPSPDLAFVDQPLFTGVLDGLGPRKVIYRPTDIHPEGPLFAAEQVLVRRADAVVATSQVVLDSLGPLSGRPALVLENGVELARFSDVGERTRSGVVYVGALDHRFDWDTVNAVAAAVGDAPVRLAGPVPDRLPDLEGNIELLGSVPYERVPAFLAGGLVGLLPLNDAPLNRSRSPMKYFEYLAAGLSVVARETPTLAARSAPGVMLYGDPAGAATAARALVKAGRWNAEGPAAAAPYDWGARAQRLLEFAEHL